MIVVMKSDSPSAEVERVSQELCRWDITPEKLEGRHKVMIGFVGTIGWSSISDTPRI